jgi:hypothetical protein
VSKYFGQRKLFHLPTFCWVAKFGKKWDLDRLAAMAASFYCMHVLQFAALPKATTLDRQKKPFSGKS